MKKITIFTVLIMALLVLGGCSRQVDQNSSPVDNSFNPEQEEETSIPLPEENSNKLSINNKDLIEIPGYILQDKNLVELSLNNNQLTAIPAEIKNLQNLEVLDLSGNQLTGLPAELGQLKNLKVLRAADNQLTGLPYELGNLQNLELLDLVGNNLAAEDLAIIKNQLPRSTKILD